ncbi:hypothetical protein KUTeg_025044 [Tegillarca granosa]|uniref:Uncharacterized protein n=1 Tax=Tegillarca granosa TaxID=220873 RepID=A0ABQ9E5D3_TEGGR|nr:hypothetical protein KUTeg_025044 [Tegillarca granosa]
MEHCISWNGKLICISKRSPHILSTVYTFDCRNRSWEREDSFEIGDSDKIEIVQCRVRTELSIGLGLPVLLIKFIDEGTSQNVTTSWSNISHVICDDFVGCGSTQILLLTNDFDCSWNNNWILTDFGVWQIDLEKDKRSKQEFDDKDNAVTAVDALRSRLQNDLVLYEEKKRTVSQRNIFILETWRRLQTMVCQSLSLIPNVNSVSLLQVDLLTTSGYQKDIGGHLAPKRRKLSSTDLSEQLQELLPLAHGTVISFCDIPKFGQLSSYNCYCLLHWNERREEDDSEVTEENIISKSKCVGEVCLTLQDVLTSKHDIDLEECLIHDSEVW